MKESEGFKWRLQLFGAPLPCAVFGPFYYECVRSRDNGIGINVIPSEIRVGQLRRNMPLTTRHWPRHTRAGTVSLATPKTVSFLDAIKQYTKRFLSIGAEREKSSRQSFNPRIIICTSSHKHNNFYCHFCVVVELQKQQNYHCFRLYKRLHTV